MSCTGSAATPLKLYPGLHGMPIHYLMELPMAGSLLQTPTAKNKFCSPEVRILTVSYKLKAGLDTVCYFISCLIWRQRCMTMVSCCGSIHALWM